eukprot:644569_1
MKKRNEKKKNTTTCNIECKSIVTPRTLGTIQISISSKYLDGSARTIRINLMRDANALCLLGRIYGFGCAELSDISFPHCNPDESYAKALFLWIFTSITAV